MTGLIFNALVFCFIFRFRNLRKPTWFTETSKEELIKDCYILDVVEIYRITGNTECLFQQKYKFLRFFTLKQIQRKTKIALFSRKGDLASAQDVRQHVTNYVKAKNLQDKDNKRYLPLA
jgi:hypothetical protein